MKYNTEGVAMSITAEAVYQNGSLILQQPLPLAEQEHVRVIVERKREWQDHLRSGLSALRQLCAEQPLHSGGQRFTREELHERR